MTDSPSDEMLDRALHNVLARAGALAPRRPTADLVARTAHRLPRTTPRLAARRAAVRRVLVRSVMTLLLLLVAVPAVAGALTLVRGAETPLARLAGVAGQSDARTGLVAATMLRLDAPLTRTLLGVLIWLGQVIATMLVAGLWPRRSALAGVALLDAPVRAAAVGMLMAGSLVIGAGALLTLLAATIAGLPVALVVLLLLQAPFVLGIVVVARALGPRLAGRTVARSEVDLASLAAAALLALPAAVAGSFSLAAVLPVLYLLAAPGLGALILSRGGMRYTSRYYSEMQNG